MRLTFKKEGALKDMMASFAAQYPLKLIAAARRTVHRPAIPSDARFLTVRMAVILKIPVMNRWR